jgi:hypothetical protein
VEQAKLEKLMKYRRQTSALGATDAVGASVDLPWLGQCSAIASDTRTPERQTCYISVCRLGFCGRANARATDARARLSGVHQTHHWGKTRFALSVLRLSPTDAKENHDVRVCRIGRETVGFQTFGTRGTRACVRRRG